MRCRWDDEAADYLTDDGPCRYDEYGDPTRHCTARRTCPGHIGPGELTCLRCLTRTQTTLRTIVDLAALTLTAAISDGIDSEAAYLAGPAADPEAWSWHKVAARQGRIWHQSLIEDDDPWHPYTVLTRWEWMIREDYGHPRDTPTSIAQAADYLRSTMRRLAHDPGQDFPLLSRELRACKDHLEATLRNSRTPDRGAPCPACADAHPDQPAPRLVRRYGHWCTDPDCEQIHHTDTDGDRWSCWRGHTWTEHDYRHWVAEWHATVTQAQ